MTLCSHTSYSKTIKYIKYNKTQIKHPRAEPRLAFHLIVANCDASVFEINIVKLAVDFKWNHNVFKIVIAHLAGYTLSLALARLTPFRAMLLGMVSLYLLYGSIYQVFDNCARSSADLLGFTMFDCAGHGGASVQHADRVRHRLWPGIRLRLALRRPRVDRRAPTRDDGVRGGLAQQRGPSPPPR